MTMATDLTDQPRRSIPIGEINKYDFRNEEQYVFKARKGLDAARSSPRSPR